MTEDCAKQIGYKIFKWLLLLILLLVVLLVAYAYATFPLQVDYVEDATKATPEQWASLSKARAEWASALKDLAQTFLLAPVLPLLGTTIGYIFGNRRSGPGSQPE
ncbi:hypothetical protein [Raineyella fluvialis]|uniref:Uncharacterized protein n=1 Tax=Raineyella fluvialis TaxID=2662261 RepID=A0A5Q2F6I4_9ACTN|nr:hypothetical protein [Raineyella fluvialis]QGF22439.1 hypothetical protein Rai3103_00645 [Raineyella fluvialis]